MRVRPAPGARLGHLWHEVDLQREVSMQGPGAASRAVQNNTFLGSWGEGTALNSPKWRRLRKRKLSWRGRGPASGNQAFPACPEPQYRR